MGLTRALVSIPAGVAALALALGSILWADEVVHMSEVEVTEKVDPPSWRYAETGAFRVWSLLEDSETLRMLGGEMACWSVIPQSLVDLSGRKVILIYTDHTLVQPAIPAVETLPQRQVRIGETSFQNVFVRVSDDYVVQVANLSNISQFQVFGKDVVLTVLGLNRNRMPWWLREALIGRYGLFEKGMNLFGPDDYLKLRELQGWPELSDEEVADLELVPMAQLLSEDWPDAEADPEAFDRWSAQSVLFVQWLVGGRGAREEHWASFRRIATYSLHYPIVEPAFAQETGFSFAEVEEELRRYLPRAVHINQIVRVPDVYHLGDLRLRTASVVSKDLVEEVKELLAGFGEFEPTAD